MDSQTVPLVCDFEYVVRIVSHSSICALSYMMLLTAIHDSSPLGESGAKNMKLHAARARTT